MWRALARFSLSQFRHVAGKSLSPVTCSGRTLQVVPVESSPAVVSGLLSNGGLARFFSDQSAVHSSDLDPAEDGPAGAVEMASGESDSDQVEDFAAEYGSAGAVEMASGESDDDRMECSRAESREISPEEMENVLSLLQGTADGSLESKLDGMHLPVHEEFVLTVLETPLIAGGNLIRFFKWASSKPSEFQVTRTVAGALVRAVCKGEPLKKEAYVLWDLVREIGEKAKGEAVLDRGILNELLSLFSRLGKGRAALEVLDKFDEFGCVPDSASYYSTVDALCKCNTYELAWPVCERMINSGTLPDGEEVGKVMSWLCKGKLAKSAHDLYSAAKEKGKIPPPSAISLLIVSLSREDKTVKLARENLGDFDEEARRYAIKPFSAVISGLCRSKELDGAKKLLHEMIEAGPPPGNAVFNSVVNGFSKAREMETAMEVKKLMEQRGLKPDLFTYTVIMSGFVSGGEMEAACKLLKEAKKKHKTLSPVMYHTLIRGYCKLEEFDKALELLREMKNFGVKPNTDEYSKLIQSLCLKALDTDTAEKLLEEMKESGLYLNGITRGLVRAVKELQGEELAAEETRIEA
ncbi:pentatricopeptide repeat-containing protein At3g02650, mitochondrial [Punica granatum]|uniref:Pentatricopeptide repeat-containing protein At3g02650, mitochondrial n=1 Tax=Punica granatum TaxID=22663 RepID=A0A218WA81_PUNGR|nr:pentatricopeptide repeat-containing protein At3g02650, mitochondrial [Punica granatum]OWM69368.1 hypothetical protein CDL15_Pgr006331 [Punica granatum]